MGSVVLAFAMPSQTQAVDLVLTGAVTAQTLALKKVYKERDKKQKAIIAAETSVTLALKQIHSVEEKVLEYLSNAQGAVANLHQIKRAGELALIDIPKNIKLLSASIPRNVKGTAIAAIVSDELKDATVEAASLYPLIAQLVSSGSYNVRDAEGTTKQKKVNLLDAAERYYIANEIVTKLENINMDLYLLVWQVQLYSFNDLFFKLTPESWCNIMAGDAIVRAIIRDYSSL